MNINDLVWSMWDDPWQLASHWGYVALLLLNEKPEGRQALQDMAKLSVFVSTRDYPDHWKHLSLKHIAVPMRLWLLSSITSKHALPFLTQEIFNFHTLADVDEALYGVVSRRQNMDAMTPREIEENLIQAYTMPAEDIVLAQAFCKQLLEEAATGRPIAGSFVMTRVPFPLLDKHLEYSEMRLTFLPTGILATLVNGKRFHPFYWHARMENTRIPFAHGAEPDLALDLVMCGIWRDACVVRHRFVEERTYKTYAPNRNKKIAKRVYLPRQVVEVAWAGEREQSEIIRSAHVVRGHYRHLPTNWKRSEASEEKAREYGYPLPPEGFTFVEPHTRGTQDAKPDYRLVKCRGLLTVATAMGALRHD